MITPRSGTFSCAYRDPYPRRRQRLRSRTWSRIPARSRGDYYSPMRLLGVFPDQKLESILERFKKTTFDAYRAKTADTSLESLGVYYTDDNTNYLWIYPFRYTGGILVVVFATDGKKRKEEDEAVRASLATLAFETGATRARLDYRRTHRESSSVQCSVFSAQCSVFQWLEKTSQVPCFSSHKSLAVSRERTLFVYLFGYGVSQKCLPFLSGSPLQLNGGGAFRWCNRR